MNTELRKLLGELSPYKSQLVVIASTGIIMALAQGGIPKAIEYLFNAVKAGDSETMIMSAAAVLGLVLVSAPCRFVHLYFMDVVSDLITVGFRRRLQVKLMNLNLSFHNTYKTGSGGLISRILNDIVDIQHGLRLVADFFREPLTFFLLLGYLFYMNAPLTLFLILILPPLAAFNRVIGKSLRKYGRMSQEVMEKLTNTIKESLDGMRTIQSYNLEREMLDRFNEEADEFLHHRRKIHARTEISSPITETLATVVILGLVTYFGLKIINQQATIGEFMSYVSALLLMQKPMKKLQESFVKVQQTLVATKRVYEILDQESNIKSPEKPAKFPSNIDSVHFDHVSFSYGEKKVLNDIDLEVESGQIIALVGASGSGKSTLVSLLSRFFDPSVGAININGIDLRNFDLQALRDQVSVVSQDVFLFRDTIEKNIMSGSTLKKSPEDAASAARLANAWKFIEQLPEGIHTQVGDRGNLLSGGEKQRIAIARAIYKDAPILILDEATSALDSQNEAEVQAALDKLMQGRTVFVVAHRLSTIERADRIIVMQDGRIVETGSHQELMSHRGQYFDLKGLQSV